MDMPEEEFVSEVFAVKGTKIKPLITMENNYHLHEYIRKLNVKKGESEDIEYSEIELTKEEITE